MKQVRNHFLDTGFIYNGNIISSRTIEDLIHHTNKTETSITFKLTPEHLSVKGPSRQKVKPAVQLFSNTTASAIKRCYAHGIELYNPIDTADFVKLINDWFDIHNASVKTIHYPGKVNRFFTIYYYILN